MKVAIIPVTPFQQNCSLLVDEATGRAAVVDPGGDLDRIDAAAFIPGHGPMSTFCEERQTNPFVSDAALAGAGAGRTAARGL